MKTITLAILAATLVAARAQITIDDPGYSVSTVFTGTNPDNSIVSYDWSGSDIYYMEATSGFTFGGFYRAGTSTALDAANASTSSGASVVSVGNFVYYNASDSKGQYVYSYNTTNSTTALVSSAANYGLTKYNAQLFLTGAIGFGTNHIYQTGLNGDGTFSLNPPKDLGVDSGSSGPLAFDAVGNLYYAPGFGDLSIYKWSASEVAAAIADSVNHPLSAAGHVWEDYSRTSYGTLSGATSMIIDGDKLLVTLTNFVDPSDLVSFGIASNGIYDGQSGTILDSVGLLGELRENDGNLYISQGDAIDLISAPEPTTWAMLGLGAIVVVALARRRRLCVAVGIFTLSVGTVPVMAGPFSPAADQPGSTGISTDDSGIVEWANSVVSFHPGPVDITVPNGATASYGTPANALGKSDATTDNPYPVVSLGDGGSITLSFAQPIANGPGADLAVYENGFAESGVPNAYFLELAKVAVSSDGVNFFTFPSVSLTPTTTQVNGFGTLDPTNLYNLAGSEIASYGTPFNLDDLIGVSPSLNLNDITEVRITDVIGNINMSLGANTYTTDDAANPIFKGLYGATDHVINDPFKTNFTTGGFDLDAVAVLNVAPTPEPSTWTLLILGAISAWLFLRRQPARK